LGAALLSLAAILPGLARADEITPSPAAAPRAVAVSAPALDPIASMGVHAGTTTDQVIHATDVDGDPLTFSYNFGPSFMTVTTVDPGSGTATGNVHLEPSSSETGVKSAAVGVTDGAFYRVASFDITVLPMLDAPADLTVYEGSTNEELLVGHDVVGHVLTFTLVGAPSWATVVATSDTTATLRIAPGYLDGGGYYQVVSVSDGLATFQATVRLVVYEADAPPALTQPADMHGVPNTITEQLLTASDPDFQLLTFSKVAGPSSMTVGTTSSSYPARGYVRLAPALADVGTFAATVGVSDGTLAGEKSFRIRVDLENSPPVLALTDVDMLEGTDVVRSVVASDSDGQRLTIHTSPLPPFMSVTPQIQPVGADSIVAQVQLLPTFSDAGVYSIVFFVTDGRDTTSDTLHVTVRDAGTRETSLRLGLASGPGGPPDYEYSVRDGTFSLSPYFNSLTFTFRATSGSEAGWDVHFFGPLAEGSYTSDGSRTFYLAGGDPTTPTLSNCPAGSATFQIKRLTKRSDGSILAFWATFQTFCLGGGPGLHGELRYEVPDIPITLLAPRWLPGGTNQKIEFAVSAEDTARDAITLSASDLPVGATFLDSGGGHGSFTWTPGRLQIGKGTMRFLATSAGGLIDTAYTTLQVVSTDKGPTAYANAPYVGTVGVPVQFSSRGTSDPEGDPLTYHWTFGDGGASIEPMPRHTYASTGIYVITLLVSDGIFEGGDQGITRIYEPGTARAFQPPSASLLPPGPIRLQSGGGHFWVAVEIPDAPFSIGDVDPFSFRIGVKGLGSTEVLYGDPTTFLAGDADGNGVPDAKIAFTREALRQLFANVKGDVNVAVAVEFSLASGLAFRGSLPIEVIGPDGTLSVVMAPNPMRPAGMLSFVTTRAGYARLLLFDSHGRRVRTVIDDTSLPAGYHDIAIDPRDKAAGGLATGIYYFRLETPEGTRTGRIAIVR